MVWPPVFNRGPIPTRCRRLLRCKHAAEDSSSCGHRKRFKHTYYYYRFFTISPGRLLSGAETGPAWKISFRFYDHHAGLLLAAEENFSEASAIFFTARRKIVKCLPNFRGRELNAKDDSTTTSENFTTMAAVCTQPFLVLIIKMYERVKKKVAFKKVRRCYSKFAAMLAFDP